ncbi:hypothetical protein CEXT_351451 [Caerostris extrusa]|uniref:Uncharacterized protein n=1 Tax=Caerostris extrusa TaxID=172846 RepID=A0AAV4RN24_CAEEX|nr:hypothetical protein CEXT_351451 [Caerostris extrusa]
MGRVQKKGGLQVEQSFGGKKKPDDVISPFFSGGTEIAIGSLARETSTVLLPLFSGGIRKERKEENRKTSCNESEEWTE